MSNRIKANANGEGRDDEYLFMFSVVATLGSVPVICYLRVSAFRFGSSGHRWFIFYGSSPRVTTSKMGNVANKRALSQKFLDEGAGGDDDDDTKIPARWTDADKANLDALRNAPITMGDKAAGQYEAQQKRNAVLANKKMSPEEQGEFLWSIGVFAATDEANDDQSVTTNITIV